MAGLPVAYSLEFGELSFPYSFPLGLLLKAPALPVCVYPCSSSDIFVAEPATELVHAVIHVMLLIYRKGVYEGIFSSNAATENLAAKSPSHIVARINK